MEPRAPVSVMRAGLLCRCPRCGEGRLFVDVLHFLRVAENCEICGLDLRPEDSGDGPAVFVMFLTGPLVVALAILVEVLFRPPLWLHALLWAPTVLIASIALLRPLKATLIALQYRHRAGEGGKNTFT
ncbi:MAG: DUF983 domain-containing protein [Rhodospirillales bacterium]|nr:MAG: DUF983 domain-containing protein [Rhodospirillales bacterium]